MMMGIFNRLKDVVSNVLDMIHREKRKHKQHALTESQTIINIIIFDDMITFTADIPRPEAYVRILKRNLKSIVMKYGFSGKYPHRVMFDTDRNIITILMDRGYQYNLERELEILKVIYESLPDDIEQYLRDTFTRISSRLPSSPIGLVDVFRRVPRHFEIQFDNGQHISVSLDNDSDRAHAFGFLSALFHADLSNETIINDIEYFNIPAYYYDWFMEYGNDIQGIIVGDTQSTDRTVNINQNKLSMNIIGCTDGIFRYAVDVTVPQN